MFSLVLGGGTNYLIKNISAESDPEKISKEISVVYTYGIIFAFFIIIIIVLLKGVISENVFYRQVAVSELLYLSLLLLLSNVGGICYAQAIAQGRFSDLLIATAIGAFVYVFLLVCFFVFSVAEHVLYQVLPLSYVVTNLLLFRRSQVKFIFNPKLLLGSGQLRDIFGFSLIVYVGLISIPVINILVRSIFLDRFGAQELSNWQAIVKVSDAYQQFYGIFCSAILLPFFSKNSSSLMTGIWVRYFISLAVSCGIFLFLLYSLSDLVVRVLLAEGFEGAQSYVLYHLVGDFFRMCSLFLVFLLMACGGYGAALAYELLQGFLYFLIFFFFTDTAVDVSIAYGITYAVCFFIIFSLAFLYFRRVK